MILTFEELRNIKDRLPHGSIEKIANELGKHVQEVRNYFGAWDFTHGDFVDIHYEAGAHGGYVKLDDTSIYEKAVELLHEEVHHN